MQAQPRKQSIDWSSQSFVNNALFTQSTLHLLKVSGVELNLAPRERFELSPNSFGDCCATVTLPRYIWRWAPYWNAFTLRGLYCLFAGRIFAIDRSVIFGVAGEIWTLMISHSDLNAACLPIPPQPHGADEGNRTLTFSLEDWDSSY